MRQLRKRLSFGIDTEISPSNVRSHIFVLLRSSVQISRGVSYAYEKKTAQHRTGLLDHYEVRFARLTVRLRFVLSIRIFIRLGF